jgi:phospholipid/cholesterol/gamma-HCH transport system substrate-binding protein
MKRANEILVGGVVLVAVALVVVGSAWLSQARFGRQDQVREARFRVIGGLKAGDGVSLRGVGIGRVDAISLGERNWVNVTLRLRHDAEVPAQPVAIISSTTLFGDWGVQISSRADLPDDPEVRRQVDEAVAAGADRWPGATLPDIGQLTASASRIAGDIAVISGRVEDAFDSTSAARLRSAFLDLSRLSRALANIARSQESTLTRIGGNLDTGTAALSRTVGALERAASRADSATSRDQLQRILTSTDSAAQDLTAVARNLRGISSAAATQQDAFARIIAHTDSILARIDAGQGTLGRLTRDTTLYAEAVQTVRSLREMLADMQRNPRKYFSFSVF